MSRKKSADARRNSMSVRICTSIKGGGKESRRAALPKTRRGTPQSCRDRKRRARKSLLKKNVKKDQVPLEPGVLITKEKRKSETGTKFRDTAT